MKKVTVTAAVAVGLCLAIVSSGMAASGGSSKAQIARGEYLVKSIGQCGDCHTPMNDHGEYVMDKWLQGTKLDFAPLAPVPNWADASPNIAGLIGWDQEKAIQFFMTGLAPNGQPARPPMPEYKMNRADAEAVVAYLRSLKQ
ncbi:MAG: c-type cytochrome [Candidatus Korobacteraceae bacterium]